MDRRAWRATVYEVSKPDTTMQLNNKFSFLSNAVSLLTFLHLLLATAVAFILDFTNK